MYRDLADVRGNITCVQTEHDITLKSGVPPGCCAELLGQFQLLRCGQGYASLLLFSPHPTVMSRRTGLTPEYTSASLRQAEKFHAEGQDKTRFPAAAEWLFSQAGDCSDRWSLRK